jgi:hypothetical protein
LGERAEGPRAAQAPDLGAGAAAPHRFQGSLQEVPGFLKSPGACGADGENFKKINYLLILTINLLKLGRIHRNR